MDSADASFVPLIGYENIPLVTDPDDSVDKSRFLDDAGAFIRVNENGNGNANSLVTPGGLGRPGSLKTALQITVVDFLVAAPYLFTLTVRIPPGIRGKVPPGFSLAQINDPTNAPLFDPSLAIPYVLAKPSYSFASGDPNAGVPPTNAFPMGTASPDFFEGTTFQTGANRYIPPQTYASYFGGLLVDPLGSPYGMFEVTLSVSYEGEGGSDPNQTIDLIVDFSHTRIS